MAKKSIRNQWTAERGRDMLQAWRVRTLEVVGLRPGEASRYVLGAILATISPLRLTTP